MNRLAEGSVAVAIVLGLVTALFAVSVATMNAAAVEYQLSADHRDGDLASENFGRSVALVDVNGDGISDLAVGSPYDDPGGLTDAGSVTVFLSKDGVPMSEVGIVNGTHANDLFGWAVANAGDLNGDGEDDLAIGAPLADPGAVLDGGNVTILFGGASSDGIPDLWINSTVPGEQLGYSLASAGDVNEDAYEDLIVGAPFALASGLAEAGRAYVYYGGSPMNALADKTFSGEVAGAHFGWSVSGGWNVDGDTSLDIVVGAPDHTEQSLTSGAAYVIRNVIKAKPAVSMVGGAEAGDKFGFSVCMLMDLDGDTYGDVAIGAPKSDDNGSDSGSLSVVLGGSRFNTGIDLQLMGHGDDEWFGWAIACGDLREDGYSDILVGAPNSGLNVTSQGRAYAYFGSDTPDNSEDIVLVPDLGADFFGGSVAVGENLTGDVAPDFAVGDPQFMVGALPNAGRAYVYAGLHVVVPLNPVVQGYVRVWGTMTGLSDFTVTLEGGDFSKSTTTTATGYFEFTAVPGTFWLNASKPGYITNFTEVTLAMDEVETVIFYPMTVPLVRGVITDAVSGLPHAGATVAISISDEILAHATTPANGSYMLYLPDDAVPGISESVDVTVEAWDDTHYTSSAAVSLARNETEYVDLILDRFASISGTVRDAITLSPVRDALVTVSQAGAVLDEDATDNSGSFALLAENASTPDDVVITLTSAGYYQETAQITVDRNASYTQDFFLQIDHLTPVSSVEALPAFVGSQEFTVTATASDGNGIDEVQLWFVNSTMTDYELYGTDSEAPYSWSFDAAAYGGDGAYEFYSLAFDLADNAESPPAAPDASTFVDTVPVNLTVTSPAEGQALSALVITVTWTATDNASGIQGFEAQLDGEAWVDCGLDLFCDFSGVDEGLHAVTVNATDVAGTSVLESVSFIVDRGAPNVTTISPLQDAVLPTASVQLRWNSSDATSWIDLVQVRADQGAWTNLTGSATNHTLTGLSDGIHTLSVRVYDGAGLTDTSSVDVSVDTIPPSVAIIDPEIGSTLEESTVTITWTMTDAGSGLAKVEVAVDSDMFQNVGLVTSTELSDLKDGQHNVTVRVYDDAGNFRDVTVTFYVTTLEEEGGIPGWVYAAIGIVAVAVVAAVALVLMRRGRGGQKEGAKPEEGPDKAK